ncbi:Glucose dehydrogenase [FAD, quinone] [Frankliniella fusca]|uniref:Glucose dehydrogenase [FAD, quinone] n=1 Tax=Frankliniella fusca TaxID=407009 RepID=A0AAE1LD01_9NEOP|nr:Glucose dehydrogenase [FAD, quinone] [Frankliniella fusca]
MRVVLHVVLQVCGAVSLAAGAYKYGLLDSILYEATHARERGPRALPAASVETEYDFVVVGAGTAGCALAARLSEVPGWRVLLLEAGGAENIAMDVPVLAHMLQFSAANWKYRSQPSDQACLGMADRRCPIPRGKSKFSHFQS